MSCRFLRPSYLIVAGMMVAAGGLASRLQAASGQGSLAAAGSMAADREGMPGKTVPSKLIKLAFRVPGLIDEMKVEPGQVVKAGQVLATLDKRLEEKELAVLRITAETDISIKAAEETANFKKIHAVRVEDMVKRNVENIAALEEAKADANVAELSIIKAQKEHEQDRLKFEKQEEVLRQMQIIAPMDGVVQSVNIVKGEIATNDPDKPALVMVQNNPIWIEAMLPVDLAQGLSVGKSVATIRSMSQKAGDVPQGKQQAKLIYRNPIADATSGRQLARFEMPNAEGKDTGFSVLIDLPAESSAVVDAPTTSPADPQAKSQ